MDKKTPEDELYDMLSNQHKAFEARSKSLTDRASGLIGLAGIIDTVLVVIVMSGLDAAKITQLTNLAWFPVLQVVVFFGFCFYIAATVFSLLAYRVKKYFPAPRILSDEFIEEVFTNQSETVREELMNKKHFALQLFAGIQSYNDVNIKKYDYLNWGALCLTCAIIFTAATGIILFLSIGI